MSPTTLIDSGGETTCAGRSSYSSSRPSAWEWPSRRAGAYGGHLKKKDGIKAKIHKHVLTVTGTNDDDTITLGLAPGDPNTLQIDTGDHVIRFDRNQFDTIVVNAGDGDDTVGIDETNGAFTDVDASTLNGEGGDDTLQGGSFNERLDGGDGNDLIDGNRGSDVAFMGAGDDTFRWDPGDGSDVVEGQEGSDTMVFNGANVAEHVDLSANGSRLRFTRDVAGITMDTDGVESVLFNALGGADVVNVNDLSATDVKNVTVDLGTPGDGAADRVVVNGTANADGVQVATAGNLTSLTGLAATVSVINPEPADVLAFDGGDGADATTVQGTAGADTMAITAAAPFVDRLRRRSGNRAVGCREPVRERPRRQRHDQRRHRPRWPDGAHDRRRRRQRHDQRR